LLPSITFTAHPVKAKAVSNITFIVVDGLPKPYTSFYMDDKTNPQLPDQTANSQPISTSAPVAPAPISSDPASTPMTQAVGAQPVLNNETYQPEGILQKTANAFTSLFAAIFSWIVFPILIVLVLHNFVFQAYHVVGTSMASTLQPSDYLIISKVGYTKSLITRAFHKESKYLPSRGEIIVFHYPRDPTEVFVKRVIGMPGDHIVIKNGQLTIFNKQHPNGFNPDTKYEKSDTVTLIDTDEIVAPGSLFVMGDNRAPGGSYDSREWGELQSSYVIGNAVLRLLPLDQAKVL
jgi:signal peptidase I